MANIKPTDFAILNLIGTLKKCIEKNGYFGATGIDLSRAFDSLNHNILLAKFYKQWTE